MNELDKVRMLDIAINELQKIRSGITDKLFTVSNEKRQELQESIDKVDEIVRAMADKRRQLIIDTACDIAEVEPIEV